MIRAGMLGWHLRHMIVVLRLGYLSLVVLLCRYPSVELRLG
jgi:hypothetical protein